MDGGSLTGSHAVVTGAASGIGSAIAGAFAAEGCGVTLVDRDGVGAAQRVAELIADGGRVDAAVGDVTDREFAAGVVATLCERGDRPGILVNAAGIRVFAGFLDYDPELLERHLQINLAAPAHWTQLVARRLVGDGAPGSIVDVLSVGAFRGFPDDGPYAASKAGLLGMSRCAALELAPHGIRVNAIVPGPTRTPLTEEMYRDPATLDRVQQRIPLQRLGQPADMTGAAVFLASAASAFLTGATIPVDGGYLIR